MNKEAIVAAVSKLETTHDLLTLLNKVKMTELGDKGYPFTLPQLNYFINPIRNKKNYRTFRIPKKSGGYREIFAPKAMLKSFLTYLNQILQSLYIAPSFVTGFVPERSVVDNAEMHVGKNFIFNIDLLDFFPSISKSRVWATLKLPPYNFNDTIADAISGLCCTEIIVNGENRRALPQGSPCSPIITNIVCRNLDRQLYKLAKKYHLTYSRYADDITFSSNHNVYQKDSVFINELEDIIKKQNFSINDKKTRLQKKKQRQEVTGLIVNNHVNVTKDYVREIDNILYIWKQYGEQDAYARFVNHYIPKVSRKELKPKMYSVIQGKLNYLKMVKGAESEVWRRLQRRFNELNKNKSTNNDVDAKIKYRYIISDFEKKFGTSLIVKLGSKDSIYCSFSLNNKKTTVYLSNFAKRRLRNILLADDSEGYKKFLDNNLIIFYEKENSGYWKIERKRCSNKIIFNENYNKEVILEQLSNELDFLLGT